jgi:serine/threonine protein kinase
MIGTKLAHYEIVTHLGSGGMGDVYQATDSKLSRSVAIKLLPEAFIHDTERAARFEREARVLASLNHTNIAAIYGIEECGDRKFLVMELAGGETLAERIKRGPIPIDGALGIARQVCEALEAAHEKGIIHRDLKPANIKITPDGKVKVLDFGLAKAMGDAESPDPNLSNSPTMVSAGSTPGIILGTAAYMSPEQAKGRHVDRRTDIFAFGCVLYEMLTGKRAFDGEDTTEIIARVLERDPDWMLLPANVPARIRELLRLCLQKEVRKRRGDAGDVRIDIEQALSEPPEIAARPAASRTRERLWMSVAAVFLLGIAALAIPAARHLLEALPPEMRVEINTPRSGASLNFALSPDGTRLAFVAIDNGVERLWVRTLNGVTARPLPGTDGALYPFWSPDSRSIGFFANNTNSLKRIDVDGGPAQTLAPVPAGRGGTWNRDATILFGSANAPLYRVPATGGTPQVLTRFEQGAISHRFPQFLPDGRHFLFYVRHPSPDRTGIYIGSLDGAEIKFLVASDTNGSWIPSGWLLYMQQGTLRAQPFDIARGVLSGNAVTVAEKVGSDNFSMGGFSTSAAGMIAHRAGGGAANQLVWFDRAGKMLGTVGDLDETIATPELSPDGHRLVVDRIVQGNRDIWIIDLLRGGATRFTFDAAEDRHPLWAPDGAQVVFTANRKSASAFDLYTKPSSGAGAEQLLLESPNVKTPDGWSANGHFLLYNENNGKTSDILALPLQGDRKPIPVANSPFSENNGQFSPDGQWVAYQSNESGRFEIYVVPFPLGAGKWQVSTGGGIAPRWRHDGKELFFISPDGQMMAATVSGSGTAFEAAPPASLFQTRMTGGFNNAGKQQYAVSADSRFLINAVANDSGTAPITLIVNWKPPAK